MPYLLGKAARSRLLVPLTALLVAVAMGAWAIHFSNWHATPVPADKPSLPYRPRQGVDLSGFSAVVDQIRPWDPGASLEDVSSFWTQGVAQFMAAVDQRLARPDLTDEVRIQGFLTKAFLHNYEGEAGRAYEVLEEARSLAEGDDALARGMAVHDHLLPGRRPRCAAARTTTASCAGARARASSRSPRPPSTPTPPAPAWRSGTSPSTSSSSPTTSRSAGCSTWPT